MKINVRILLTIFFLPLMSGCVASFKPANIDEATGQFPANAEVDKQYIKIFQPLAGIKEANYVY
jgi:hypothetical protein